MMTQFRLVRTAMVAIALGVATLGFSACGGKGRSPSAQPQIVEGTIDAPVFQVVVVNFQARSGRASVRVDWEDPDNDIDTALVRGTCTANQIATQAAGCADALVVDESLDKPSTLSIGLDAGPHTVAIFNWGPSADTASYRIEVN